MTEVSVTPSMPEPAVAEGPARKPQVRASRTRHRILEATVSCLIDHGYAGTTTVAIQKRAAVSRGALMHHFPSREQLVIAALHHLRETRLEMLRERAKALPADGDRFRQVIDLLWEGFDDPHFFAALELWTAARTDPTLHAALYEAERENWRYVKDVHARLVGEAYADDPRFEVLWSVIVDAAGGIAIGGVLRKNDKRQRERLEELKELFLLRLSAISWSG